MMYLHSDANCFYASVEAVENPELRGRKMAVCGDTEQRHGIVLTASYPAKRTGVKTGMANWEALQKCPELIIVHPHYALYLKYSALLRRIYRQYSDYVEPFGMDECWISVPLNEKAAVEVAEEIRQKVKDQTGLTVSVGVSFSKVLAKLGSDMKKPDAVTVLTRDNFREKCWDLPATDLLYVGPQTGRKLLSLGIRTIGQLAQAPEEVIRKLLGKNGTMVQSFAQGTDNTAVAPTGWTPPIKSIGHGATCVRDLEDNYSVWLAILELAQSVSQGLIENGLRATAVSLYVRDNEMMGQDYRIPLAYPTQSACVLSQMAYERFLNSYPWVKNVRALTVTAQRLQDENRPEQLDLFGDCAQHRKRDDLEHAVNDIRRRFGKGSIRACCFLAHEPPLATDRCETVTMPGQLYRE